MSFGQGLGSGTGVGLIGGILAAVYTYILFVAIDPGLLEEMILRAEDEMYNTGTPDDQIEMAMEYVEKFMQPGIMSFFVVLVYAISGFVASLICSGILQKTDPSFESNFK